MDKDSNASYVKIMKELLRTNDPTVIALATALLESEDIPKRGFRSGIDAVMLAAAVPAQAGDHVLELGCGVGVASLCLDARIAGLGFTGVEVQPAYADLAAQNVASNGATAQVICADLRASHDAGRDVAMAGDTPLADWIDVGIKRLAPKGTLTIIQHIARLPEVLQAMSGRLGSVMIRPIAAHQDAAPGLFVCQAKHSGRAPFVLSKTWIMHGADAAKGDVESYTPQTKAILRNAASFPMCD